MGSSQGIAMTWLMILVMLIIIVVGGGLLAAGARVNFGNLLAPRPEDIQIRVEDNIATEGGKLIDL